MTETPLAPPRPPSAAEALIERAIWNVRYVMLIPVITSLLVTLGVVFTTTFEVFDLLGEMLRFAGLNPAERAADQPLIISEVVAIIDGYLLAGVLIIFALGLYELFISKIALAEGSEFAGRLLLIRSLDDLKDRLANVILLILIVKLFQQALKLKYEATLDLLYLALAVFLIGGALWLTARAKSGKKSADEK